MRPLMLLVMPFLFLLASCGDAEPGETAPETSSAQDPAMAGASHHGAIVALGQIQLGDEDFTVARHGACVAGKESAFVVSRIGAGTASSLFLWVEDAEGEQISAPAQGDRSGEDWHFHITPRGDAAAPAEVVLRLREEGRDERSGLSVHDGAAPIHDGVAAPVVGNDGEPAGWLELKLHDDKGDLELWLARDGTMTEPLDLPVDAVIVVTFLDQADRKVELRVRDEESNEDEDGKANLRSGGTNYFIFPGETGADASWLRGADFRSAVTVSIPMGEETLSSAIFVLLPHGHGPDGHQH